MLPAHCILNSAKLVLDLFFLLFCQHQQVDGTKKINGIVSKRGPDGVELLLMSQNCCSWPDASPEIHNFASSHVPIFKKTTHFWRLSINLIKMSACWCVSHLSWSVKTKTWRFFALIAPFASQNCYEIDYRKVRRYPTSVCPSLRPPF